MSQQSQAILHIKKIEEFLSVFMYNQSNIDSMDKYEVCSHFALFFKLKDMHKTLKCRMSLNGLDNVLDETQQAILTEQLNVMNQILDNPRVNRLATATLVSNAIKIDTENENIIPEKVKKQIEKSLESVFNKK